MANNTVFFPGYSAGENAYKEIDKVCSPYGTKAVVISDEISINATKKYLDEATQDGIVKIDYILFPGEASFEAVDELEQNEIVKNADMIFCLGGGKAIDTGKLLAHRMNKPYFTFPTIASTCACNSALGIYYYPNHEFRTFFRVDRPPVQAGVALAACCTEPLLKYGVQAMEDCRNNRASKAIEEVALNIFINTGMVSNMVDSAKYNTSLAHAFFNASTTLPQIEARHKHGEVVSYGTLLLLTLDKQYDKLERFFDFYKGMELPTKLADLEIEVDELDPVLELAVQRYDLDVVPYEITPAMIKDAILELEEYNKKRA